MAGDAPQATPMCECSHHWGVHAESGQTANTATCHGYTGSATPGPLREPCGCTGFRPWAGPWDSRTGMPVKPLTVTTAADPQATPGQAAYEPMRAEAAPAG